MVRLHFVMSMMIYLYCISMFRPLLDKTCPHECVCEIGGAHMSHAFYSVHSLWKRMHCVEACTVLRWQKDLTAPFDLFTPCWQKACAGAGTGQGLCQGTPTRHPFHIHLYLGGTRRCNHAFDSLARILTRSFEALDSALLSLLRCRGWIFKQCKRDTVCSLNFLSTSHDMACRVLIWFLWCLVTWHGVPSTDLMFAMPPCFYLPPQFCLILWSRLAAFFW